MHTRFIPPSLLSVRDCPPLCRNRYVALLTSLFLSNAAIAASVFREGFDGFRDQPDEFTEVCLVHEAPPSLKTLGFRPKDNKLAEVYKGLRSLPPDATGVADYEFAFRFSFPKESSKTLNLHLVCGSPTDKSTHTKTTVLISQKTAGIRSGAPSALPQLSPTETDLDLRPMPEGLWCNALVRSRGKTMELFFENDGRLRKFAQAEVSGRPLLGFNFSGTSAFDLDDIEIRSLAPLPPGPFQTIAGVKTAINAAEDVLEIPGDATRLFAKFRVGSYPGAALLKLRDAVGGEKLIDVRTGGAFINKPVTRAVNELDAAGKLVSVNKTIREKVALPDGVLHFKERNATDPKAAWSLNLHTRPRVHARYTPERELEIAAAWQSFPAASEKFIELELRPDATGAGLWMEGRYAGRIETGARPVALSVVLPAHGALKDVALSKEPKNPKYEVLDVRHVANPGALGEAKVSMDGQGAGARNVSGVPFLVGDGSRSADLGKCRENLGSFLLECDGYLSRTPFDGLPESFLFSVPPAQYTRAWVLCAVEEDPSKNTVLTARLTKFQPGSESGRGPAIADTSITLPRTGEALPPGVRKVGEISMGEVRRPLYLVECALDVGAIQEIQFQEKAAWLDFELLGKRNDQDNFYVDRSRKPSNEPSGVHVFAATLERSPIEMFVQPGRLGNAYKPSDKPRMNVTLSSPEKRAGHVEWTVRDIKGGIVEEGKHPFQLERDAQKRDLEVVFSARDLGWYSVDFQISSMPGEVYPKHRAFFALIAEDDRKAGYESPYFTWNFAGAHGTIRDIGVSGALLLDAGIRHTHIDSEEAAAAFKLGRGQFPRLRVAPGVQNPEEALGKMIRENLAKYPHTKTALIFHESGGGPFPLEIVGGQTRVDEKQVAYDKAKAEHLGLMARAYRANAPHVKLVVGNSGMSTPGLLASLFRAGAPREYFDYLGDETVGMTVPPELSVAKENWILKEVARVFGYGDLPVNACYEWKARRSRHLGLERHAEWNVRDILIAHAWRQSLIPTFGLPDVSNSYYNTVWGDGAFTHNPQVYPKPTYPAVATATQVLDCATFERMVPTGSATTYVLEFKRGDMFVYALWCARGKRDAILRFPHDSHLERVEMLGRRIQKHAADGKLTTLVTEAPSFLISKTRLSALESLGKSSFPRETLPSGTHLFSVDKMERAEGWLVDSSTDHRIDVPAREPVRSTAFRRPGTFEIRAVRDEERGECLELELAPKGDCPALMQEYTFLRLKTPVPVPGTPSTVVLQVKGNSSWGKIFWEIEDAEGERWISAGSGGYGCEVYDWPELAGINFEGWHQLQFPITAASPIKVPSPGENGFQWQRSGRGNGRIDYPIRVTGIAVSLPRQTLNLLNMQPVTPRIRLGGLGVY